MSRNERDNQSSGSSGLTTAHRVSATLTDGMMDAAKYLLIPFLKGIGLREATVDVGVEVNRPQDSLLCLVYTGVKFLGVRNGLYFMVGLCCSPNRCTHEANRTNEFLKLYTRLAGA